MSNLIPMDKAAAMLGLSVDRLAEMRSNNEIFGYRDGSSWKFKPQELERVAEVLGISLKKTRDDSSEFDLSDSSGSQPLLEDSDESGELVLDDSSDSGILSLAEGSVIDEDTPDKKKSAADTDKLGAKGPGSSKEMPDDDLMLAEDEDLSSDFEDSDLILEDSDSNPDIQAFGKKKPKSADKDSEFALSDEVLQLGGSDIDDLELSEDRDMLSLAQAADADADDLAPEDDFNLTPLERAESEDSSGSQVIALSDSDLFAGGSEPTLLKKVQNSDLDEALPLDSGLEATLPPTVAPPVVTVPSADAPFTLWQVLSLGLLMAILLPGGMIAFDLCRNLWMPEGTTISTGILPWILEIFQ